MNQVINPKTFEEAQKIKQEAKWRAEYLAGGTDVFERINSGVSNVDLININDNDFKSIELTSDSIKVGAFVTLQELLESPYIAEYTGLVEALSNIANPQTRATATVGGSLTQKTRCWYFRNKDFKCLKKGGEKCYARGGENQNHSIFDLGPCISVHPSTLGMVLLAYGGSIKTHKESTLTAKDFFGDGSNPTVDNTLTKGEIVTEISVPVVRDEVSTYYRLNTRALAEWPIIELYVRAKLNDGLIEFIRLTAGAVAPVPVQLSAVEEYLLGKPLNTATIKEASEISIKNSTHFGKNKYKIYALKNSVQAILSQL